MMKKKITGRLTSAVSAAALAVTAFGAMPAAPVRAAALTGQDAKGITSQMKVGWNLGNTLDCEGTGYASTAAPKKFAKAWGNPEPTEELFETVKQAGFNTVRIPTTWYEHLEWDESSQMYLINDSWMDYVHEMVDYCYDRDMFIILNVHHEEWVNVSEFTDATYQDASKKLTDIWTQVADEFQDYDQHLIFEGMNEPRQTGLGSSVEWGNGDANSRNYVNRLNAVFVDTVRSQGSSANKERLLMLPGYVASSDPEAIRAIEIPANAGNVALSVHAYSPYFFTMATDSYANHTFPGASGYGEDYESSLTNMFNTFNQIQNEKGAPIIIGEFGASDFGNTEDRVRWATSYLTKAKAAGIPCVLWDNNVVGVDNGESHGYLYRATNTWYNESAPVVKAMMDVYGITANLPAYREVEKPVFDWSKIPIGDNWVELYRSETGQAVKEWGNISVKGWKDYVSENYDLVMIYESDSTPEIVLMGSDESWNRLASSDESETPFMLTFTYDDLLTGLTDLGESMDIMNSLFISDTGKGMTAYGLYAVPKGSTTEPETTEPAVTEPETTEPVTTEPNDTHPLVPLVAENGDVDGNGKIEVLDIVVLQKYLLGYKDTQITRGDINQDGVVNIVDLGLMKVCLKWVNDVMAPIAF